MELKDYFQATFINHRQILDGILGVNELVDSMKQHMETSSKLTWKRLNDHVKWNFVDYMVGRFVFGDKWRGSMKECISTTASSMLVNGSPASRELGPSNPLSPFCFSLRLWKCSEHLPGTR